MINDETLIFKIKHMIEQQWIEGKNPSVITMNSKDYKKLFLECLEKIVCILPNKYNYFLGLKIIINEKFENIDIR